MNRKKFATIVGGTLAGVLLLGLTAQAAPSLTVSPGTETFYVDGQEVELEAYAINGNNYVKLRDVGELVNFGVTYDQSGKNVTIDPDVPYTSEAPAQTPKEYNDVPYKTVSLAESDPNYYKELWAAEYYNYRMVRSFLTLYVTAEWNAYRDTCIALETMDSSALTDADRAGILAAKQAREQMGQLIPYAEGVLYIWGDNMPTLTKDVEEKFTVESWDNPDFRPFLVPYLQNDPSKAKGNIILISGGGNRFRGTEAQDTVPSFLKRGYNCFVLGRRVEPYGADDIAMDLQRAVRYIRYHGEKMGLGGMDIMGIAGFSGGGGNIRNMLEQYYGNITPDQFDKKYTPDDIDAVNSDVDLAMIIYSGGKLKTENPNLPNMFIAVGEDDNFTGSIEMFQQAQELGLDPELHIFGNVVHGFGPGTEGTSSATWVDTVDLYVQNVLCKQEKYNTVPAEYTLKQTVIHTFNKDSENIPIDVYINSDHSKVFMSFSMFGDDIQLEGILVGNSLVGLTFDSVGFFAKDAPILFDLCDPNAWAPVQ